MPFLGEGVATSSPYPTAAEQIQSTDNARSEERDMVPSDLMPVFQRTLLMGGYNLLLGSGVSLDSLNGLVLCHFCCEGWYRAQISVGGGLA